MTYIHSPYFNFCLFDSFIAIFRNVFFIFFLSIYFLKNNLLKFQSEFYYIQKFEVKQISVERSIQEMLKWDGGGRLSDATSDKLIWVSSLLVSLRVCTITNRTTYSVYDRQSVPVTMSRAWLTDEGVKRNKHGETETKSYR